MNAVQSRNSEKRPFGRRKRTGSLHRSGEGAEKEAKSDSEEDEDTRKKNKAVRAYLKADEPQSNWTSSDKLVLFRRQNEHFAETPES